MMRTDFTLVILLSIALAGVLGCAGGDASANSATEPFGNLSRSVSESDGTPASSPVNTPTGVEFSTPKPGVTPPTELQGEFMKYLRGDKTTNVARAQAQLFEQGMRFYMVVVSPRSTGLEGEIWMDLKKRNIRATTGPDEGFDTSQLDCFPNCVFVHQDHVNYIGVASWVNVLHHEQRHMVQAANNPNLARAFRPDATGPFTTYAAFLEACADDAIFVGEEIYHASERLPQLKRTIGDKNKEVFERACQGYPEEFGSLVAAYEDKAGTGSFARLFPPYK